MGMPALSDATVAPPSDLTPPHEAAAKREHAIVSRFSVRKVEDPELAMSIQVGITTKRRLQGRSVNVRQ
jgi:hypothetical protein